MQLFEFIKTMPNEESFTLFEQVVPTIYPKDSPRFILGNDPSLKFLEGCYILLRNKIPVGRFAFYENPDLKYNREQTACIGSYECVSELDVSEKLLSKAKEIANSKGYKSIVGPMEGSTWNNYRFSTNNEAPNFFMEPYHPIYYNDQFKSFGFESIAQYISNIDDEIDVDSLKIEQFENRFTENGAVFRTLDLNDFENELYKIGAFSIASFEDNFLYTPIDSAMFVEKYRPLKTYFDPQLIWIVEDENKEIQAIIFAIKDYLDSTNETFIIKSIARKKDSKFKGIGTYLALKVLQIGKEMGYKKVIHALMIKENISVNISSKFKGKSYKGYALYALKID